MIDTLMVLIGLICLVSLPTVAYLLENNVSNNIYMKRHNTKEALRYTELSCKHFTAKTVNSLPGYHKTLVHTSIRNKGIGAKEEIDIIHVHETGVYVFELEHKIGWIKGKESEKKWINAYEDGSEVRFYNPIKQNRGHINVLKSLLTHVQESQFKSMIVFSKQCGLDGISINPPNTFVFKQNELERIMKEETNKSYTVLTKEQIDVIYNVLKPHSKISENIDGEDILE